jgi:hypothetical protein
MFDVYWHDINYKENKEDLKLVDFYLDDIPSPDNMTVNFTLTFEKPYMVGLLLKRSDKVFIVRKPDFNISKEFFFNTTITGLEDERGLRGNQSIHRLYTNSSDMRVEMQFDYRNANM